MLPAVKKSELAVLAHRTAHETRSVKRPHRIAGIFDIYIGRGNFDIYIVAVRDVCFTHERTDHYLLVQGPPPVQSDGSPCLGLRSLQAGWATIPVRQRGHASGGD